MLTCPMHKYMYMVNRGSGPPPPTADLCEVVSCGGLDRGRVAVKYNLLIFSFITGSICSPVMNITFFLHYLQSILS